MALTDQQRSRRPAFTLIEVVVVVGIIAILACLIVPAVQSAREAGRRAQCISNMRQFGLALSAYESIHNMFTPGYMNPSGPNVMNGVNHYSGFAFLLPFLDQPPLFSSINFDFHAVDNREAPMIENRTARATTLRVLLCPSDTEPHHQNSYCFNYGTYEPARQPRPYNGPFAIGFTPTPATITDGLSTTAFVSERIGGSFDKWQPDTTRDMKIPPSWPGFYLPPDEVYIPYCLDSPPSGWIITGGRYWIYNDAAQTFYNHNGSPNDVRTTCGGQVFGLLPPRSQHHGFVHVLFGDGHVEAVQDGIDQHVWSSLGTCANFD